MPVTISTGKNPSEVKNSFLLTKHEQEFVIEDVDPADWVKLNTGTTGFYRVEYDQEMLAKLLPAIANGSMPELDRFGITNDLFALVFFSYIKSDVNLGFRWPSPGISIS